MHILFTCGPLRGPFSLLAGGVASCLLAFLDGRVVVRYQFMGAHGPANMIWEKFGGSFFIASLGVHQVPPGGLRWLFFFMVGAGEGDMTCAQPVGKLVPPGPDGLSGTPRRRGNVGLRSGPMMLTRPSPLDRGFFR